MFLNWLIHWSLTHRRLVLAGSATFAMLGWLAATHLNIDAFPDTTPTQVQINTVAPALSPEEIERQITMPIEQAISGLPDLVKRPLHFEVRSLAGRGHI